MRHDIKIIAFYLPQFHSIPENDRFWGSGYTDWVRVKNARPLYPGHRQPRVPLYGYYDLAVPRVRQAQALLARKYGIYGFCYYHYWFDGKPLLEKPLREVLSSGVPNFPFCLAWINESWTRVWEGKKKEVLIRQSYGQEDEWRKHFAFLRQAFQDKRAIRVNGKPIFLVYVVADIPRCREMVTYWRDQATRDGLPGLYLIAMRTRFWNPRNLQYFDALVDYEPHRTIGTIERTTPSGHPSFVEIVAHNDTGRKISYEDLWSYLQKIDASSLPRYLGAFVDWDNSPRRKTGALIVEGGTPKKFERYLKPQLRRVADAPPEQRMLFLNAWNEWSEGNYLEPDTGYRFQYLAAVRRALQLFSTPLAQHVEAKAGEPPVGLPTA